MTDIEGFLTIYGHSDNLLNNKYMLFIGREVRIGENWAQGRRPRAVRKTEGTVFPYTDRPRLVNNVFFFLAMLEVERGELV